MMFGEERTRMAWVLVAAMTWLLPVTGGRGQEPPASTRLEPAPSSTHSAMMPCPASWRCLTGRFIRGCSS